MLALSKLKRNLPVCYLHNRTNGQAGLARFQIGVLAKHVEKHKLHTHCSGCSPGSAKIQSPERTARGSVTKRGSNFPCSPVCYVCRGKEGPEEDEQRMLQQSGDTESELSLQSGEASAWAVQGGCRPEIQTCSWNKNYMRCTKPI